MNDVAIGTRFKTLRRRGAYTLSGACQLVQEYLQQLKALKDNSVLSISLFWFSFSLNLIRLLTMSYENVSQKSTALEFFSEFFSEELNLQTLLNLARIAETSERYEDMCEFTYELVRKHAVQYPTGELSIEQLNLLSVAFKHVVDALLTGWRILSGEPDEVNKSLLDPYKKLVEEELREKCNKIITLLLDVLIPSVRGQQNESEVAYLRMCADYYRYLSEFMNDDENKQKSETLYLEAMEVAKYALKETNPTRLSLALNFSVFFYEILKEPEKAYSLAKDAFDQAVQSLDNLSENDYRDSTLIMQLLRDNMALWASENAGENADDDV